MKRFYSGFQGLRSILRKMTQLKLMSVPSIKRTLFKRKESECVVVGSLTLLDSSSDPLGLSNESNAKLPDQFCD